MPINESGSMAREALSLAVPMYLLILLGHLGRRAKLITDEGTSTLTNVVLYFCVPALIINSLLEFPDFSAAFLSSFALPILGVTAVACVLSLFLSREKRGVFIQGAFRGNVGFMGLPIVAAWLGSEAVGKAALLVALFTPYAVTTSLLLLTYFESGETDWTDTLLRVLLNPLTLSVIAALGISALPVDMPGPLMRALTLLENAAFPMSVLVIGSSISLRGLRCDVGLAILSSALKLLALPLLGYAALSFIHISPREMGTVITLLAMPAAVTSAVFAREFSSQEPLGTGIVLLSTLASPITLSLVIYLGECLGLLA